MQLHQLRTGLLAVILFSFSFFLADQKSLYAFVQATVSTHPHYEGVEIALADPNPLELTSAAHLAKYGVEAMALYVVDKGQNNIRRLHNLEYVLRPTSYIHDWVLEIRAQDPKNGTVVNLYISELMRGFGDHKITTHAVAGNPGITQSDLHVTKRTPISNPPLWSASPPALFSASPPPPPGPKAKFKRGHILSNSRGLKKLEQDLTTWVGEERAAKVMAQIEAKRDEAFKKLTKDGAIQLFRHFTDDGLEKTGAHWMDIYVQLEEKNPPKYLRIEYSFSRSLLPVAYKGPAHYELFLHIDNPETCAESLEGLS